MSSFKATVRKVKLGSNNLVLTDSNWEILFMENSLNILDYGGRSLYPATDVDFDLGGLVLDELEVAPGITKKFIMNKSEPTNLSINYFDSDKMVISKMHYDWIHNSDVLKGATPNLSEYKKAIKVTKYDSSNSKKISEYVFEVIPSDPYVFAGGSSGDIQQKSFSYRILSVDVKFF